MGNFILGYLFFGFFFACSVFIALDKIEKKYSEGVYLITSFFLWPLLLIAVLITSLSERR